tara:strand:- start:331 stop:462 length:132 start_codon:yes stop_codon:yes gene_type:complete
MKKRKLNSKNPKYAPKEEKKIETIRRELIANKGKVKVYAVFKD